MGWKEVSVMEERSSFVLMAERRQQSFSSLCLEYGISRKGKGSERFFHHFGIGEVRFVGLVFVYGT